MAKQLSKKDWQQQLTPEQYRVLREKGTEVPGSGTLLYNHETGMYVCAACGASLFSSRAKYDSTTPGLIGWPSFDAPVNSAAVKLSNDDSLGMARTEVSCSACGSHLGHLFADASSPNGQHYCINSVALEFKSRRNV